MEDDIGESAAQQRDGKNPARALVSPCALEINQKGMTQGVDRDGADIFLRAVVDRPSDAEALHRLGIIAYRSHRWGLAVRDFGRAARIDAINSLRRNNLAGALLNEGRADDAVPVSRVAVVLAPNFPEGLNNLGLALDSAGQADVRVFRWATGIRPDFAEAYNNLGRVLQSQGEGGAAETAYNEAIALNPMFVQAWSNRGRLALSALALQAAERYCRIAVIVGPGDPGALNNLGGTLHEQGRADEAFPCFDRTSRSDPDYAYGGMNRMFSQLYRSARGLEAFRDQARNWWAQRRGVPDIAAAAPTTAVGSRLRRRVGFVSADFRQHAVGFLAIPAIEGLARRGYEVFCYANNPLDDGLTQRLRAAVRWRSIVGASDQAVARSIRADGIDILIDLGGFTADNRLTLFAGKPAPVQVSWLGYPGTTGLATMDYILADRWQIPATMESAYTEKVVRLPDAYVVYQPPVDLPGPGPLPLLSNGSVTFGSFNALKKVSPALIARWAEVLRCTPRSRLIMKSPALGDSSVQNDYRRLFENQGIAAGRLIFLGRSTPLQHQMAMAMIDIALDTFPYTGGLTTLETLWMGVPVITCYGDSFSSRHSLAYLSVLGLADFAAETMERYVEQAIALAADRNRLVVLRATLRDRLAQSPLCDIDRFCGHVESALNRMWLCYTKGQPAAAFDVPLATTDVAVDAMDRLFAQALAEQRAGRAGTAEATYRHMLTSVPDHDDSLHLLGVIAHQRGQHRDAIRLIERAVRLRDDVSFYFNNLSLAYEGMGQWERAAAACDRALALDPEFAPAHNNRGVIASNAGHADEALGRCRVALILQPDLIDAWANCAVALQAAGRLTETAWNCERRLFLRPDDPETWYNLGWLRYNLGAIGRARHAYRMALSLVPDHSGAINNLGVVDQDLGNPDGAVGCFGRAYVLAPTHLPAALNRMYGQLYQPGIGLAQVRATTRAWIAEVERSRPASSPFQPLPASAGSRPRLGFLSGDFCHHAVGLLVAPAIEALHRQGYEIACYDTAERTDDSQTTRFRRAATLWRSIVTLSDDAAIRLIREDRIDILFDLSGYTSGSRALLCAARPAPVQVAWAGYPATTGLRAMDYILADRHQIADGAEEFYSEAIIRLPHSYIAFEPPPGDFPASARPPPSAASLTFGSFNMTKKIGLPVLALWSRVLRRLPTARLILKTVAFSDPFVCQLYLERFAAAGITAERLTFLGETSSARHRAVMTEVDIILDTFPYSGGLTTLEALWMGVPVVTLPAETFASRHTLGYLRTIGLADLAARDPEHYVELAVGLATDLPRLASLRAQLRERMTTSPLCDITGFSDHLDRALRAIWRRHCDGLPPVDLSIAEDGQVT